MFSNWAGTSGWKTTDDPTGVLSGRVLIVEGPVDAPKYEILKQELGTSSSFDISHYVIKCNYAFQPDWQFNSGLFLLMSRITLQAGTNTPQTYYGAGFDVQSKSFVIFKYLGSDRILKLANASIGEETDSLYALRKAHLHEIKFRTFGTTSVTLELEINGVIVLSYADTDATRLSSGFPGLLAQRGTLYIDTFNVKRYTVDSKEPTEWTPSLLGSNVSVSLTTTGISTVVDPQDPSKYYVQSWADQSGNANNAVTYVSNRPGYAASWQNNYPGSLFEKRAGPERTTSFYLGPSSFGGTNSGFYSSKAITANTPWSVSFWVFLTNTESQELFGLTWQDSGDLTDFTKAFTVDISSTQLSVTACCNTTPTSFNNELFFDGINTTDMQNKWVHLTVTYTGVQNYVDQGGPSSNQGIQQQVKVYKNGVQKYPSSVNLRNPQSDGQTPPTWTATGSQQNSNIFLFNTSRGTANTGGYGMEEAFVADLLMFDKELDQDDIDSIYNNGNYKNPSELAVYSDVTDWWEFEESANQPRLRPNNVSIPNYVISGSSLGGVPLINNEWYTYMYATPTQGSSPTQGTGDQYYFGTSYVPYWDTKSPTNGEGSLYFGNIGGSPSAPYPKRYLKPSNNDPILINSTARSLSFWIRLNSISQQRIFTALDASDNEVFIFEIDENPDFRIKVLGDAQVSTPGDVYCELNYNNNTLQSGVWAHIVIVWTGTATDLNNNITLYLNNSEESTTSTTIDNPNGSTSGGLPAVTSFLFFAKDILGTENSLEMNADNIYDVGVYGRALDSTDVNTLYNGGDVYNPMATGSLATMAYWRFIGNTTNRRLYNKLQIENSKNVSYPLTQIGGNLSTPGVETNGWNIYNQAFSITQKGPAKQDNEASLFWIPDDSTLDMNTSGVSMFVVVQPTSQPDGESQFIIKKGTTDQPSYAMKIKDNALYFQYGNTSDGYALNKFGTSNLIILGIITGNDPKSGIYINGSLSVALDNIYPSNDNTEILTIGADAIINGGVLTLDPTKMMDGGIGDLLIYKGSLTEGERQKLEGFLAHKWGITSRLPSTHPYITETPKVGD